MTTTVRPTIKTTFAELSKHGITNLKLISHLNKMGLDSEIVSLMQTYDIFPQTYYVTGAYYVAERDILMIVNTLLKNNMRLYEAQAKCDEAKEKAIKYLDDNKIALDPDDLAAIESGEKTLAEIVDFKKSQTELELNAEPTEVDIGNAED